MNKKIVIGITGLAVIALNSVVFYAQSETLMTRYYRVLRILLVSLLASASIVSIQTPTQAVGNPCPTGSYLPDTDSFPTDTNASLIGSVYLQSNNLFYKVNKNSGEAVVVSYDRNFTGDLVVPENVAITGSEIAAAGFDSASTDCLAFVKTYKVRFISEVALAASRNVTAPVLNSVSIEAKIKSIGRYAFQGQCKIDSLVIPDSVTDIGESAFWYMDSNTANNPNCATSSSHGLKSITLGVNLQRLYMSVFGSNQRLNTITFRGPVLDVASPGTYPSTYDLWNVSNTFPSGRLNNLCSINFTYVFASLNVLTNSQAGWNSWATANNCFSGVNLTANVTTAPGKVDTPTASNPTQTTADVTFTAPANNGGSAITGYVVTSIPDALTASLSGATGGTVTITGLTPATIYRFEVVANNASGASISSELSNSITTLSLTAPNISLSSATETATAGSALAGYTISNTGGPVASYSISPTVGNGLSFNSTTGILTGTPSVAASAVLYTITGTNNAGSDTATFTLGVNPRTISIAAVPITAPVSGATPLSSISSNGQYTTAITWNGSPTTFAPSTVYTATATLTPVTGYTLTGVTSNFFTVTGATSVANSADAGVATVVFPATAAPVVVPTPTPTPTPTAVVTGPPPSSIITLTQPKISRDATHYICTTGTFLFIRNGYTEEAPKLTSQTYFLVQNGKILDTIESNKSEANFEKKSQYLNTTLNCVVQVGQENLISTVSSLDSKKITSANEDKRTELQKIDTKYYADRTAAYAKKDKEFARIAGIKSAEIAAAKTAVAISTASTKYRKSFSEASELWKLELSQASINRASGKEAAQTTYLDTLEKAGVSIYPQEAKTVVTPTPTPTVTPKPSPSPTPTINPQTTPSPTPTINPQPTAQMVKVGTVYMATGSYQLSLETKKQLVAIAKTVNASTAKNILVYGHTDIRGGVNNTVLSQNRAKAVAKFLRPLLTSKKISIGWYASKKPVAGGTSAAALALNRRVEIYTK